MRRPDARAIRIAAAAAVLALGACATEREVVVVERSYDPEPVRTAPMPRPAAMPTEHVVARGDTLYAIAFHRGLSVRDLAAWNGLEPPYLIRPGQRLRLGPGTTTTARSASVPPRRAASPVETYPVRPPPPQAVVRTSPVVTTAPSEPVPLPATPSPPPAPVGSVPAPQPSQAPPEAPIAPVAVPSPTQETPIEAKPAPVSIASAPSRAVGGVAWRWPAKGTVTSGFRAGDAGRQGVDIRGRSGDPVLAAADGEVVYSGNGLLGYGELIIVKHAGEYLSAYAYNRKRLVSEGERVRAGQPIAEMGRRGGALDALHFEIRRDGQPVDPLQFLPPR